MTDKQSNQQPDPQSHQPYYEDEINLIDYFRVILKWKWFIVVGTLLCVITAAIISLQMPRIYEVSAVLEPGILGVKDSVDEGFVYIDSAANIRGKIGEGIYNRRVVEALSLDPLKTRVEFKTAIAKGTDTIRITSQWQEGDTDLGMKVIRQMIGLLSDDYEGIVKHRKSGYDEQIKRMLNSIENTQDEIKLQQAKLKSSRQRKGELTKEIRGVKENTEKIVQQRDVLLEDKRPNKDLSLLLYSTTIQQNVAYFNQLSERDYILVNTEKETENKIDKLTKTINDIESKINTLNLEKELIGNVKIIKEPEVSLHPVKPKKKQIVLLAGFASLFMFVFLAFLIEYIRNASKEE